MTKARSEQISLDDTPFYHCYSRCVRRVFLCGFDKETGENFEHRKGWIVDRMRQLATVFCMDICAFVVMDNHYHIVLRIDEEEAKTLSVKAVLLRWKSLFYLCCPIQFEQLLVKCQQVTTFSPTKGQNNSIRKAYV